MAESGDASSSGESSRDGSLSESSATDESYAFEEEEDSASDGAIEPYMYEPVASDSESATRDEEETGSAERLLSTDWWVHIILQLYDMI